MSMKTKITAFLLGLAILFPCVAEGQVSLSPARRIVKYGTDPTVCRTGDVFYDTVEAVAKLCTATNTWTILGSFTGGTVTSPILLPAGTAGAPAIGWSADADGTGTGWYRSAADQIAGAVAGAQVFLLSGTTTTATGTLNVGAGGTYLVVNSANARLPSGSYLGWSSASDNTAISDTILYRDAAGILGLRNATTAQELRVWDTFTSVTNGEWGGMSFKTSANVLQIGSWKGSGGGSAQPVEIVTDGTASIALPAAGGVTVKDRGTKPTCDSSTRGTMWYDAGGAGVADTIELCGKAAADTYSWVALATF